MPEAPEPLREFFIQVETVPDWVDRELMRRGQRAMRRGGADGMYVARDVSLLGGYQFSGFNKTLLRTGALEKGSNKRFAETMQWAMDVIAEDGLDAVGGRLPVHHPGAADPCVRAQACRRDAGLACRRMGCAGQPDRHGRHVGRRADRPAGGRSGDGNPLSPRDL